MRRFRSCLLALPLACAAVRAAVPPKEDWKLPPLDGELAGEFDPVIFGGAPKLRWKMTVRTQTPLEREVAVDIDGLGFRLRGEARLDPRGDGTWRISESEIDLGEWFGWVAAHLSADLASATAGGKLRVTGAGSWRGGVLGGRASLSWREGTVTKFGTAAAGSQQPKGGLFLEGISVDVNVADIAARRTELEQVFTWRSGRYDVVPLGVGRVEFALDGDQLRVNNAAIDVFGGELRVGSLEMSTSRPEFSVIAEMNGVAVDQIMFLLPRVLSEARGRVDGYVELKRDGSGIEIGNGRLALREGETADLRLAVKPGWLTTSLPPEIVKYFPGFRKIETGEIPIRARVLEMTFTPLGDARGRTAWVHVAGGPSDPELTAPIDTTINVRGPLEELVKIGADLGTDSRLRFSGSR
jgi:hypothetical protein